MPVETSKTIALYGVSGRIFVFDNAIYLDSWEPPCRAGLYAIYIVTNGRFDVVNPIYIGESSNLSERGFESHHKLGCWKYKANGNRLAVAVHMMPYSSSTERKVVESELVAKYDPICND